VKPSGDETWDAAVEATYEANDNTFSMPANPAGEEFETAWQDAVNRVLNGQQSPEEAMKQAQKEGQKALDDAWAELEK
jgi:multiple sugar transport system substrate-binding protein